MDRGLSQVHGRFNQKHTALHRMELMPCSVEMMHLLTMAHPELSFEEVAWLVNLSVQREHDQRELDAALARAGERLLSLDRFVLVWFHACAFST